MSDALKDKALAISIARDEAIAEVGGPPEPDVEIPDDDLTEFQALTNGALEKALGFQWPTFQLSVQGGRALLALQGVIRQSYALGVERNERAHTKHLLKVSQASTAGILKGILQPNNLCDSTPEDNTGSKSS